MRYEIVDLLEGEAADWPLFQIRQSSYNAGLNILAGYPGDWKGDEATDLPEWAENRDAFSHWGNEYILFWSESDRKVGLAMVRKLTTLERQLEEEGDDEELREFMNAYD